MGDPPADETSELAELVASGVDDPAAVAALDGVVATAPIPADGAQARAIAAARAGHSFVLEGPPGTGKSQTITNLIAEAVGRGKKVLFVAEKMAALEVVKRRLDGIGLGDACLELHSHKTNKKGVVAELRGVDDDPRRGQPRLELPRLDVAPGRQDVAGDVGDASLDAAPVLAAIGALAALLKECTIHVERETAKTEPAEAQPQPSA